MTFYSLSSYKPLHYFLLKKDKYKEDILKIPTAQKLHEIAPDAENSDLPNIITTIVNTNEVVTST